MYVYDFETDPEGARMSLVEQKNPGPVCFFCGAVMIDNGTRMMILTENIDGLTYRDLNNTNSIVQPNIFDFKTSTWTIDDRPPVLNEALRDVFQIRNYHSTVLGADGLVYTIGGKYHYTDKPAETSWYYNPIDNSYGTIANYNMYVYRVMGHNSFVLSDTTIGSMYGRNSTSEPYFYYDFDMMMVLDTVTKSWIAPRTIDLDFNADVDFGIGVGMEGAASVTFGQGKYVFISGGSVYGGLNFLLRSHFILNLDTNRINLIYAEPTNYFLPTRSHASLVVISEKFLVLGFGLSQSGGSSEIAGIDLLRIPEIEENLDSKTKYSGAEWMSSLSDVSSPVILPNDSMSMEMVLAIVFAILVLICIGFIATAVINRRKLSGKSQLKKKDFYTLGIFNFVWPKRMGETFTIQLYNFSIRLILCIVLLAFMFYFIYSIIYSPVSTTETFSQKENMTIPDIRFCFSGWNYFNNYDNGDLTFPLMDCLNRGSANNKEGCGKIVVLNKTFGSPSFSGQIGHVKCYMHISEANKSVVTKESPTLSFYDSGIANAKHQSIHIQFYEPEKNPNRVVYLNETIPDFDVAATDRWLDSEVSSGSKTEVVNQVLTIYPDTPVSVQFQTVHTAKLDPNHVWNYFGVFPKYIKTSELSIIHTDVMNRDTFITTPQTSPTTLGEIQLSPASFSVKTIVEKKNVTVISALGVFSGIVSMLLAVQVFFFGARPTDPWGMFQKASVRKHQKQDKKEEMERYFRIPDIESVPFVTPVHQRFSSIYKLNSQDLIERYSDEQDKLEEELLDRKLYPEVDSNSDTIPLQGYTSTGNLSDIETRLSQLEGRNQILELVLKAYYIDDKVFRELYSPSNTEKAPGMERVDSGKVV
ncbi:hypothetical protein BDF21DRAFT_403129 [Thamnidium elegans]|nr:hypothetical protein BDF21DRAFT_403129 [Thamnidium elegans]